MGTMEEVAAQPIAAAGAAGPVLLVVMRPGLLPEAMVELDASSHNSVPGGRLPVGLPAVAAEAAALRVALSVMVEEELVEIVVLLRDQQDLQILAAAAEE